MDGETWDKHKKTRTAWEYISAAFSYASSTFEPNFAGAMSHSAYLCQSLRPKCAGHMGISPLCKVICTLWQLFYGIPGALWDELFDVAGSTAALRL